MNIAIRGIPVEASLRAHVAAKLSTVVDGLPEPVTAQATFFDDNGPKGGRAMRCALTVRRPYGGPLRAEEVAATARRAFDESLAILDRALAEERDRIRESKRRPKKYYVARRLQTPEALTDIPAVPPSGPPRRSARAPRPRR